MTTSRIVSTRRPRSALTRILDSPTALNVVPTLPGATLHRLVEEIGLEDAAEIVALASPSQLEIVFDEALWRGERAGQDARFDGDRFGLWLEVLLEAGERFAARTLAELSPDLVTLALCRRALVLDLEVLADEQCLGARADTDADPDTAALEHALDGKASQEIAGYLVLARADEGFDALAAVLLALDEHDHAACARLLARAAAVTSTSVVEHGGLVDAIEILTAEETLEADAAGERADRRAAAGHVAPTDAAAFFRLARRAPPERPLPGGELPRDPITRAYFRELGTKLSSGATDDARRGELAYVANLVIAGCAIGTQGELPQPRDALRIASAVTHLGARVQGAESRSRKRHVDKLVADILRTETADRLFRRGLFVLQHEVALVTARHITAFAERLAAREPSLQGVLALGRRAVVEGEPWILRPAVSRLLRTQADDTVALVGALLGPLPLVPPSLAQRLLPPSQRLLDGRGLLASREDIAQAMALLEAALT